MCVGCSLLLCSLIKLSPPQMTLTASFQDFERFQCSFDSTSKYAIVRFLSSNRCDPNTIKLDGSEKKPDTQRKETAVFAMRALNLARVHSPCAPWSSPPPRSSSASSASATTEWPLRCSDGAEGHLRLRLLRRRGVALLCTHPHVNLRTRRKPSRC